MNRFSTTIRNSASSSAGDRGRGARGALTVLGIGLLVGVGACVGPLDPIVTEQPEDRDPTTDPVDGTAFHGWMSDGELAFALIPKASPFLG